MVSQPSLMIGGTIPYIHILQSAQSIETVFTQLNILLEL